MSPIIFYLLFISTINRTFMNICHKTRHRVSVINEVNEQPYNELSHLNECVMYTNIVNYTIPSLNVTLSNDFYIHEGRVYSMGEYTGVNFGYCADNDTTHKCDVIQKGSINDFYSSCCMCDIKYRAGLEHTTCRISDTLNSLASVDPSGNSLGRNSTVLY